MKNLLKKISAVAMAFTMLGTDTAISKNSPKPTNTLTAHAEFAHNCWSYKYTENCDTYLNTGCFGWVLVDQYQREKVTRCAVCHAELSRIKEDELIYKRRY